MEREDHRKHSSPNVFFGSVQTLWATHEMGPEGFPVEKPFVVSTLWLNLLVMLFFLLLVVISQQAFLKRQLCKV